MKSSSNTRFILTIFAFSWTCWGIAIATGRPSTTFPNIILYMLGGSGPTLVALFYLFQYFDRDARREFWSRLIGTGRIHSIWWFLCLFAIPILVLFAIALDLLFGARLSAMPYLEMLTAQPAMMPMFAFMMLIGGALSEELGWRGFVLDGFQRQWTPLRSTLTLSLIWFVFHLPLFFLRGTTHYEWRLFSPMFWLFLLNVIPLTAWLTLAYNHNQRSILSAVLIHFSYNFILALLTPISVRAFAMIALLLFLMAAVLLKLQGWSEDQSASSTLYHLPTDAKS